MLGYLFFILACILLLIVGPFGFLFTFIKTIILWDIKYLNNYYWNIALSLDQLGNVVMSGLFNAILINKYSEHLFGNPDETISSVLGKNFVGGTLTIVGWYLNMLLNKIEKDHTIKSIED